MLFLWWRSSSYGQLAWWGGTGCSGAGGSPAYRAASTITATVRRAGADGWFTSGPGFEMGTGGEIAARIRSHTLLLFMALGLCQLLLLLCFLIGLKEQEICRIEGERDRSWGRLCPRSVLALQGCERRADAELSTLTEKVKKNLEFHQVDASFRRVAAFWSFQFGTFSDVGKNSILCD